MTTLFINGSPNKMGIGLLQLKDCSEIKNMKPCIQQITKFMTTVKILQTISSRKVIQKVFAADTLVIGSPVYWHSINGLVRNFLDRQYGVVTDELVGKKLYFIFQGSAPTQEVLEMGDYTMCRYAGLYGMDYLGMVNS